MQQFKSLTIAAAIAAVALNAQAAHHEEMGNKPVAKGWIMASCGELDAFMDYIEKHMAADGVFVPDRYVGLGFTMDGGESDDYATVSMVTPGTPAAEVLQEGDVFVTVDGVDATWENRDKLTFRGEPGEPVQGVIRRDGKEMAVEVSRGIIATKNDKARSLRGLTMADADEWPTNSCKVHELVEEGNVVYAHFTYEESENDTGIDFTESVVSRFEFNDDGKIMKAWQRGESRFVLEQLGYTISR